MADDIRKSGKYDEYTHRARSIRDMEPGRGRANVDKQGRVVGESTHKMAHERIDGSHFLHCFQIKKGPAGGEIILLM